MYQLFSDNTVTGRGGSQANVTPFVTISSQTIFSWTDKKICEQVYNEDDGDFDVGQQEAYKAVFLMDLWIS